MSDFMTEFLAVLNRTPATLDALLRDLPEPWISATDGNGTWSAYDVLGHLIHCEQTDWMPRLQTILSHGTSQPFAPVDREAQFARAPKPFNELLDEFSTLRRRNLEELRNLNLQPAHLELLGTHPAFGPVTLRQLLATWTAHDMAHLLQISRTLARRYRHEVGPWAQYLSVMK
jgi:hypothetical protein